MEPEQVVSRIVDEIRNEIRSEGVEFNLDDPFEDPALCTTAFIDIDWQDEHGNSALMLAAAENRALQVKGILTMAINSGKLWQVLDMRNEEGLNCVEMAVRAGSELCAMLITKVAREYAKHRPRPPATDSTVSAEDVNFSFSDKKHVEQLDDNYVKELVRQSSAYSGHSSLGKKLSREKLSNSLARGTAGSSAGHEYLKMVKRSRSAHSRLFSQRTFSVESFDSSEPTTPQLTQPPTDHGVFSSVGERIRSIFSKKPPVHSKSLVTVPTAPHPPATRSTSVASKPSSYHSNISTEVRDHGPPRWIPYLQEDQVRLPQHSEPSTSGAADSSGMFRGFRENQLNTVSTSNGVRLPPLSLRRRASSEARNRDFSSLGEQE